MPIVTSESLKRMVEYTHDVDVVDNVLVEWILAIESFSSTKSSVERIFPILSGNYDPITNTVQDMFKEGIIDKLPNIKPKATMELVSNLLKENGIECSAEFASRSVRDIVVRITEFLNFCVWRAKNQQNQIFVVAETCHHTINLLRNCNHVEVKNDKTLSVNVDIDKSSLSITTTTQIENKVANKEVENQIKTTTNTATNANNEKQEKQHVINNNNNNNNMRPLNAIVEELKQSVGFGSFGDVSTFVCNDMLDEEQKTQFLLLKNLKDKVVFIANVVGVNVFL